MSPKSTTVPSAAVITRNPAIFGGEPIISGLRIGVADIVVRFRETGSSEATAARFLGITVADVDAALAYYEDHRAEIDSILAEDEAADGDC